MVVVNWTLLIVLTASLEQLLPPTECASFLECRVLHTLPYLS